GYKESQPPRTAKLNPPQIRSGARPQRPALTDAAAQVGQDVVAAQGPQQRQQAAHGGAAGAAALPVLQQAAGGVGLRLQVLDLQVLVAQLLGQRRPVGASHPHSPGDRQDPIAPSHPHSPGDRHTGPLTASHLHIPGTDRAPQQPATPTALGTDRQNPLAASHPHSHRGTGPSPSRGNQQDALAASQSPTHLSWEQTDRHLFLSVGGGQGPPSLERAFF
uniref:Uncharacterized protein n=1 Tax=Chrysemys picta bellii TaxID=8478 RepID=A0A8C3I021_CHRPI